MEKKSIVAAIDLGTSNVVVAVGSRNAAGRIELEGVVSKPSEGVVAGAIENIELTVKSIKAALAEIEGSLQVKITEAYAGISGEFIRCARHNDFVFVVDQSNGIRQSDVDALYERMLNVQAPGDEAILERIPQNYVVDGNKEVANPVGSFGARLSSTFNFILSTKTPIERLQKALIRSGIKPLGIFANALVTPDAILLPDEKEEGVAVVDIGGGVTDVTIYYNNVIRYVATIPMGGSAINRDIRSQSIPEKRVEQLKVEFGCAVPEAVPEGKLVQVKGRTPRESKEIMLRNLATIIQARLLDLIEFITAEIKDSGFEKQLGYGIVLTGGCARLREIAALFKSRTGMEVRVAAPDTLVDENSKQRCGDPACATAIGLVLRGLETGKYTHVESRTPQAEAKPAFTPPVQHTFAQPAAQPAPPAAGAAASVSPESEEQTEGQEQPRKGGFFSKLSKVITKNIEKLERADDDDEI